jgi:P4 family phage/plasmid primase-like protien
MGWSPLPLKIKEKSPVPTEFTGASGKYVDELQLKRWLHGAEVHVGNMVYLPGNVALRLPKGVIGIDVDTYDGKKGAETLATAEERWGPLPNTWVSTSRHGTGSGIRFFRIPKGLAWPGQVGPGIEIVRWDHRYAMVHPSIHPEGRVYEWVNPKGKVTREYAPAPGELPKLPKAWVKGLTEGKKWEARATVDMDASQMQNWLSDRPEPDDPCDSMRAHVRRSKLAVMEAGPDGGAHEAARDATWGALRDCGMGHAGISWALAQMRKTFLAAVGARRGERQAKGEWARLVQQGIEKVAAESDLSNDDPCVEIASGKVTVQKSDGTSDALELSEQGNAERLAAVADGRLLYLSDNESWRVWDSKTGLWEDDQTLQRERWAYDSVNLLKPYLEDEAVEPDFRGAIRKHIRQAEKIGGMRAALEMIKARPGHYAALSDFDSDPEILACSNGLLRLTPTGGVFRNLLMRDDRITLTTGVPYDPKAQSVLWDDFLSTAQPDPEVRAWLCRLVGYSLLGHNRSRKIIMCLGPTTTGKGTFVEAISSALGKYAGPSNLTIFRDNQDERPRADLAAALPKRIIFCDEASHSWKLHPDQIKRLTGAGVISARKPFAKAPVEMLPAFTPWLMTNSVPSIEGADLATRRRLLVVPFNIPILRADTNFAQELARTAGSAILRWALDGYADYCRMGDVEALETPEGAREATSEFVSSMSELDSFIAECCTTGPSANSRPAPLAEAWSSWQDTNGTQARDRMTARQFALALNANGYPLQPVRDGTGSVVKIRVGLALQDKWAKMFE